MSKKEYCTQNGACENCSSCLKATEGNRDCQGVPLRFNLWQFNTDAEGGGCSILGAGISKAEADAIKAQKATEFISEERLVLVEI